MALTTRVLLFVLATLGVVLAGFSGTLYVLSNHRLERQAEERLASVVDRLVAGAEFGPGGVEWEPQERALPSVTGDAPVVWQVQDEQGHILDQAGNGNASPMLAQAEPAPSRVHWQGQDWLVLGRTIQSPHQTRPAVRPATYAALRMQAGICLAPMQANLRLLAATLAAVSVAVWFLALIGGRILCRRALRPVRDMAQAAREISAFQTAERLPRPGTGDELEELGRAFNGLLDRLQTTFERQARFTGEASHQLRTPLAALLGQVEVTLRRPRTATEYHEALTSVHRQAMHLQRIVEALLFLARSDAEAHMPGREQIDLARWLDEHLAAWSQHTRVGDLHLKHGPEPMRVRAHPILLGELVNILLENACKYSAPETPVTLHLSQREDAIHLAVQDCGCGISEQDLSHIFEPFFRSAEARRRGVLGVGLGLAIAKRLAEGFGGQLTVESQLGSGSVFTLRLPAATPDDRRDTDAHESTKQPDLACPL